MSKNLQEVFSWYNWALSARVSEEEGGTLIGQAITSSVGGCLGIIM